MGSRSGFDANLDLAELAFVIDNGSGTIPVGQRQTNAATNLGELTLLAGADVALSNSISTAQNCFAANHASITYQPNTSYVFEGQLIFDTGATTHTTAFGFGLSGTALAFIQYTSTLQGLTSGTINTTAPSFLDIAVVTSTVLNATSTATTQVLYIQGSFLTGNGSVTLTPQVTFSAGPTGTCKVRKGSYIITWPVVSQ